MSVSLFIIECGLHYDLNWLPDSKYHLPYSVYDLGKVVQFAETNFPDRNVKIVSTDVGVCKSLGAYFGVRANILQTFKMFCEQAKTSDLAIVYYAGHGFVHENELYLVPGDFRQDMAKETGVPLSTILSNLQIVRGQCLVFLDCCRKSAQIDAMPNMSNFSTNISEGIHLFLGCSDGEACHETSVQSINGGIFTQAMLSALEESTESCSVIDIFENLKSKQLEMVREIIKTSVQRPRLWSVSNDGPSVGSIVAKCRKEN